MCASTENYVLDIRKIRQFNLPIDYQLDFFDKVVMQVFLYGCDIWGYRKK